MTQVGENYESDDEYSIITARSENNWRKLRIKKISK
jgi:hypothetical protein